MSRIPAIIRTSILGAGLALGALVPHSAAYAKAGIIYAFQGGKDGAFPFGGVYRDDSGTLYGTTLFGGSNGCSDNLGCGTVFRISPKGNEEILHAFTGGSDGALPRGGLIADQQGSLYGTTSQGGGKSNPGTVFKITPDGTETILHRFGAAKDGVAPLSTLTADSAGNLYGTTVYGGGGGCSPHPGCGTVFKLAPDGKETVLHAFSDTQVDGAYPYAGLTADAAGNLYGMTAAGGPGEFGTVFKIAQDGTATLLLAFKGGDFGSTPYDRLVADAAGNLYGTTSTGGAFPGLGVVFKLAPDGTETVLHSFSGSDGATPYAGLVIDKAHNLYGATTGQLAQGDQGYGNIFRLGRDGTLTLLHTFVGTDGTGPNSTLDIKGSMLYGTAEEGGSNCNCGVVFAFRK